MKVFAVVVCVVAALAVVHGDEDEKSILEQFMEAVASCKEEAGEGLSMVECFKTYSEGGDMNTPEFNKCKCAGACVTEKLGNLRSDMTWNWERMEDFNNQIKAFDEDMYNENIKICKECKDKVGGATDKCEAAFKLFTCAAEFSDMVKEKAQMIASSFS